MSTLRYDDLIAMGTTTVSSGAAPTLSSSSINAAMDSMHRQMEMMDRERRCERDRRIDLEKQMYYYGGPGYTHMYPPPGYPQSASSSKTVDPLHECSVKTEPRHRSYKAGLVEYHRKRGKVDVDKLEKECKEPACVLNRITG